MTHHTTLHLIVFLRCLILRVIVNSFKYNILNILIEGTQPFSNNLALVRPGCIQVYVASELRSAILECASCSLTYYPLYRHVRICGYSDCRAISPNPTYCLTLLLDIRSGHDINAKHINSYLSDTLLTYFYIF